MSAAYGTTQSPYGEVMRRLRGVFVTVFAFSAVINVLMLTGSVYMMQVYDRVLASGSVETLIGLFAVVTMLYAFLGLYDFLRTRLLSRAGLRLDRATAQSAFRATLSGGRGISDLETVRGALSSSAVTALFDLPFAPLYLGLLFMLHPWLGWLTLAGALVAATFALVGRWSLQISSGKAKEAEAASREIETGSRRAAETVSALGLQDRLADRWRVLRDGHLGAQQAGADPAEAVAAASKAFRMFLQSAILTLGAYLVIGGEMSAGMIIAASILSGRALAPMDQIAGQVRVLGRAIEAHRRLKATPGRTADPSVQLPPPEGRLEVLGLTKFVPGAEGRSEAPRILTKVSFSLEPGEVLGVVGSSGSGKSTLARCLLGGMAADGGTVRLDGATLGQWSAERRNRFLGYLPQRVEMIHGTVRDNICRFDPEAGDDSVIAAASLAGVHELILAQENGYDTLLGGPGAPFSGGQMQRIALARAVFGGPAFVVLDEPNSNLDKAGEKALLAAIKELKAAGTTVVLIAHNMEILSIADRVLVLKKGAVVSFGDHDEIFGPAVEKPRVRASAQEAPARGVPAGGSTARPPSAKVSPVQKKTANRSAMPLSVRTPPDRSRGDASPGPLILSDEMLYDRVAANRASAGGISA